MVGWFSRLLTMNEFAGRAGGRGRPPEFYTARVDGDGKIHWRGMTLVHIKDLDEDRRKEVIEEIRRLKEQGFGRNRVQKTIAEALGVYVPEMVLRKLIAGSGGIEWNRCGPRGHCRDLKLRQKIYDHVVQLRTEGKSYGEIQRIIEEETGVKLSKSQISEWCKNVHRPDGSVKEIPLTSDTWWLLGLLVADGSLDVRHVDNYHKYRLMLEVKDEVLIRRAVDVLPGYCYLASKRRHGTLHLLMVYSRTLYELLSEVRRLIEEGRYNELIQRMGEEGVRAFIRGFFDGDGSGLFVHFANSDLRLLEFIRYALKRFDIETSLLVLITKKGTSSYHGPKKQWIVARKDVYVVYVFPEHYDRFFELIGTTLKRKSDHVKLSMRALQRRSRKYGRTYLDEIRRRYESEEDWVDVILPLVKRIGANMKSKRE